MDLIFRRNAGYCQLSDGITGYTVFLAGNGVSKYSGMREDATSITGSRDLSMFSSVYELVVRYLAYVNITTYAYAFSWADRKRYPKQRVTSYELRVRL